MSDDFLAELGAQIRPFRVHVCLGPNCTAKGSPALLQHLEESIWRLDLQNAVEVIGTSCRDRCEFGPSVNVYPGPVFYNYIDRNAIDTIVIEHLQHGQIVDRYVFRGEPRR
ncbi:MAG: (2Fe-2S) ferredoxin domain-containing protein [Thermomicrobiales bacterium]